MGILDRINTLVRANINDLVYRSEEPERALDGSMQEMSRSLAEARAQIRSAEQSEARLVEQIRAGREEALLWEERAMEALRRGDEAQARECLVHKKRAEQRAETQRSELQQQRDYVADLGRSLDALQIKLDAVRSRRESMGRGLAPAGGPTGGAQGGSAGAGGGFVLPSFDEDRPMASGGRAWEPPVGGAAPPGPGPASSGGPAAGGLDLSGRRSFVFDDELRRRYPEEAFGAARPFEEFDRMSERVERMEARAQAAASLGGDDPLRDDLPERFRRLEQDAALRRLHAQKDAPPAPSSSPPAAGQGAQPSSDAGLSELRRRLAKDLDE